MRKIVQKRKVSDLRFILFRFSLGVDESIVLKRTVVPPPKYGEALYRGR